MKFKYVGSSKCEQLRKFLKQEIASRRYIPGQKFPSIRELCKTFNTNKTTINKVISNLIVEGILQKEEGKGTFVADHNNKKTKTIYVIIPDIKAAIYSLMLRGIEDVANQNDYTAVLCNSDSSPEKERKYLERFLANKATGFILAPTFFRDSILRTGQLKEITKKSRCVFIHNYVEEVGVTCVVSDDVNGSYHAVKYLIELGHRRIVHIAGPQDRSHAQDKIVGYKKAISEAGIIFEPELIIIENNYEKNTSYKTVLDLINKNVQFTAIFFANDELAISAYKAIKEKDLNIPKDISIVGYGDLEIGRNLDIPLTTVHQPFYDMGKVACEKLLSNIEGNIENKLTRKIELPTRLIIRDSISECKL